MRLTVEIPVEHISYDMIPTDIWDDLVSPRDTETALSILEAAQDDGVSGLSAAIYLLQAEVDKERGF